MFIPLRDLSIRKKLMLMSITVSASVLLCFSAAFIGYELWTFKNTAAERLETDADIIGLDVTPALQFDDAGAATVTLTALRAIPSITSAAVYSGDGRLFAKYVRSSGTRGNSIPDRFSRATGIRLIRGDDLIVARRILFDGKPIGTVYIQSKLKEIPQRLRSYTLIALGVLAASFAVALAVSSLLARRISAPLLSLADTARTIGSRRDYSVRSSIHARDETGVLAGAFNDMLRQIEDQNHTLQESERNFHELADAMPQIVWISGAGGEPQYINQRWFEYTGSTSGPAVEWGWREAAHPDDLQNFLEAKEESRRSETPFTTEVRIRRAADGAYRWHLARALPVYDKNGRIVRWFGTFTDIEDQKRAESEVREINTELERRVIERTEKLTAANEELAKASQAKDRFLASMSHELRTPLNGIIGFAEFLADGKPGPVNDKQKEYLGDVLTSGRHLLHLINDMLDMVKVQAGKVKLNNERFHIRQAMEEVSAGVRPLAENKRIEMNMTIAPDLDMVMLDQQRFRQILYNLLSNALKFTDDGGRVGIDAAREGAERFRLAVRDNGIGIKAADMQRLFTEFEQLETGAARRFGGTGLGLALTRQIVHLLGGVINVESEFGKGSAFTVVLPIVGPEEMR